MGIELKNPGTSFVDLPLHVEPVQPAPWAALLVTRSEIDGEIDRLLDTEGGPNVRRACDIVHPSSRGSIPAVTAGMSISINVVRPGEEVDLLRDNATRLEFFLRGEGVAQVGDSTLKVSKWSICSVPSMTRRVYRNEGREPLVWLSYSNTALLERLGVYYADTLDGGRRAPPAERTEAERRYVAETAPDFPVLGDGARLRGYEFVTDIQVVENRPLLWPWEVSSRHLCEGAGDGKRNLLVLYNPATGRRQGTTHSFFGALTRIPAGPKRPPQLRGHKHTSFACNYHFEGSGDSIVDGQHFEWEAGDLMLSAPSWSEHAHGIGEGGASVLTVQDHPFQIAIESLIWQEVMDGPILTLGSEPGQTGYVGPRQAGD